MISISPLSKLVKFNELRRANHDKVFSKRLIKRERRAYENTVGFDTEWSPETGDIYLIATKDDALFLDTLSMRERSLQAINFVFQKGRGAQGQNAVCVFHSLVVDRDALIKGLFAGLSKGEQHQIRRNSEVTLENGLKLQWLKGKHLNFSNGHNHVFIYDTHNFFEGSLEGMAKEFLGAGKGELSNEKLDIKHPEKYLCTLEGRALLRSRCMKDAELTENLMRLLRKLLIDTLGFEPAKYNSKASIAECYLVKSVAREHLRPFALDGWDDNWKWTKDRVFYRKPLTPKEQAKKEAYEQVLEYAYRSYHGGMFLSLFRGKAPFANEKDFNSAFPYQMSKLVSLANGEWKKAPEGFYSINASYGFYHVLMRPNGRFPFKIKGEGVVYPKLYARFLENYLTKDELQYLLDENTPVSIINGWEFFTDKPIYPFKEVIKCLHLLKEKTKKEGNSTLSWLYKIIMNASYGKFGENNKRSDGSSEVGILFNPVYVAVICARTRLALWERADFEFKEVYYLSADACRGLPKSGVLQEPEEGLGAFEYKEARASLWMSAFPLPQYRVFPPSVSSLSESPTHFLSLIPKVRLYSDVIHIQSGVTADAEGKLTKRRGVGKQTDIKKKDYAIDKETGVLLVERERPLHMGEAVIQGKADSINKWVKTRKKIDPFAKSVIYPDELLADRSLIWERGFWCEAPDEDYLEARIRGEKKKVSQTPLASAPSTRRHTP